MNEQDKKVVQGGKAWLEGSTFRWRDEKTVATLIEIIDRLDKQLNKLLEVGEPFVRFYGRILYVKDKNIALTVPPPDEGTDKVTYEEWSRLAQTMKEVQDE